jgi:hypothetical protein
VNSLVPGQPAMPPNQKPPPHSERPAHAAHEPAHNQFGLRGMFLLMTACCLIFAAISWTGIRQPWHLVGVLAIVVFCGLLIGLIELTRCWGIAGVSRARRSANRSFNGAPVAGPMPAPFAGESPFALENPFREDPLPPPAAGVGNPQPSEP